MLSPLPPLLPLFLHISSNRRPRVSISPSPYPSAPSPPHGGGRHQASLWLDRSFAWAQVFAPAPIFNRDLGRDPPGDFGRSLQPSCGWDPPCVCSAPPPSLAQSHTNLSLGRRSDLPQSRGGPGLRDSVEDING